MAEAGYGLIGEKLGHSFSPYIHGELGGYDYRLIELERGELGRFLKRGPSAASTSQSHIKRT